MVVIVFVAVREKEKKGHIIKAVIKCQFASWLQQAYTVVRIVILIMQKYKKDLSFVLLKG